MKLIEAYEYYCREPSPQAREVLGGALFSFIKATIASNFGDRFDSVQDAIGGSAVKVLTHIDDPKYTIKDICNFTTSVTCNTVIDMRRAHKKRKEQVLLEEERCSLKPQYLRKLILDSVLAKLSEDERKLVEMKTYGVPNKEIAQEFGIQTQSLKNRWAVLQQKLRTLLGGG